MKTRITLRLDTRRIKKDGTCPLSFRMYRHNSAVELPTDYCIPPKDWNQKKRIIKNSYKGTVSVPWLNNYLAKTRSKYIDHIQRLYESGKLISLSNIELKEILIGKQQSHTLYTYTDKLIQQLKEQKRIGTAKSYQSTKRAIEKYKKGKDMRFEEISYDFLMKFETRFLARGNSRNGLAVYMRTLRAIYNKAIKDDIVKAEYYPFKLYTIKTEPTQKRAIDIQHIQSIENLSFEEPNAIFHAKNYFLFSFYLMGISFSDLAHLKKSDIHGNRITFSRQKTSRKYNIIIPSKAQSILDYYLKFNNQSDYIFPIITQTIPSKIYDQVRDARKRFNKRLKIIAELCNIEKNLTSYVSRHSYATLAKNKGVPLTAISEMLGHESIKTTQVYLDSLPSEVIDRYHLDILGE